MFLLALKTRQVYRNVKMNKKHNKDYGTPISGSKTEARGKKAHQKISGEIVELCAIIEDQGQKLNSEQSTILFGRLFDIYTGIPRNSQFIIR